MNSESEANESQEVYMPDVEIKVPTDLLAEQSHELRANPALRFIP